MAIIALVPTVVSNYLGINFMITQFLGGTGLLITVSVMLDFINRVEANLVMRNYGGLTDGPSGMPASRRRTGPKGPGQIGGDVRESAA